MMSVYLSMNLTNILTPLVGELSIGGIGGFMVGYSFKKVTKIVAFLLGIGFISLQYLAYKGIISINYGSMKEFAKNLIYGGSELILDLIAHAPFGAAFTGGFYLGIKKG